MAVVTVPGPALGQRAAHEPALEADADRWAERQRAAAALGAERRRLWLASSGLSLVVPPLLYATGTWEGQWYGLAASGLPLGVRAGLFLAAFHLLLSLVLLPLAYYGGFRLSHAFGLSRQGRRAWLIDWAKGTALGALFGVVAGGTYLWAVTQQPAAWWLLLGAALTAFTLLIAFLAPYVLVPIFFKMRPLADAETSDRLRCLADRAGASVREVCSLDFSRRTAEANAAVLGMGRSRRVVLADTLLADFTPAEVDAVVAHELGHHVHRDVPRLLAAHLALMWAGLALAAVLGPPLLPVLSLPWLGYVPGYPQVFAVAEAYLLVVSPLANWWSRRREAAADAFALRVTDDAPAFAGAMRRLASQNLLQLQPPRWAELLLATHPPLYRRLRMADAYRTTRRPSAGGVG